jgi:hypothetical protein
MQLSPPPYSQHLPCCVKGVLAGRERVPRNGCRLRKCRLSASTLRQREVALPYQTQNSQLTCFHPRMCTRLASYVWTLCPSTDCLFIFNGRRWPDGPMVEAWGSFMKWGDAIGACSHSPMQSVACVPRASLRDVGVAINLSLPALLSLLRTASLIDAVRR